MRKGEQMKEPKENGGVLVSDSFEVCKKPVRRDLGHVLSSQE